MGLEVRQLDRWESDQGRTRSCTHQGSWTENKSGDRAKEVTRQQKKYRKELIAVWGGTNGTKCQEKYLCLAYRIHVQIHAGDSGLPSRAVGKQDLKVLAIRLSKMPPNSKPWRERHFLGQVFPADTCSRSYQCLSHGVSTCPRSGTLLAMVGIRSNQPGCTAGFSPSEQFLSSLFLSTILNCWSLVEQPA